MNFVRFSLALVTFAGLMLGSAWAKQPKVDTIISSPQHLKASLGPETILLTKLNVRPDGPEVAKAILAAGLDQATQFVPLPDTSASEPEPVKRTPPQYPYDLHRNGRGGSVKFLLLIGADGTVKSLYCYQSSHPQLAIAAAEALITWKFKPAKVKDTAVSVLANQTLSFDAN